MRVIFDFVKKTLSRLYRDPLERTEFFLKAGLVMNFAYTVFGIFTGLFYSSAWYAGTAIYYILLCILKFYLLRQGFGLKKSRSAELLTARNCGRLLLLLNAVMLVLIYRMVEQNRGYEYSDTVLVGTAVYTVIRLFAAVGDRIAFRKKTKAPAISSARTLSLTVAMMASFSLQATLLDRLGADNSLRRGLNIVTGSVVGVVSIVIALKLIFENEKFLEKKENSA